MLGQQQARLLDLIVHSLSEDSTLLNPVVIVYIVHQSWSLVSTKQALTMQNI